MNNYQLSRKLRDIAQDDEVLGYHPDVSLALELIANATMNETIGDLRQLLY